jgi:hypothetical protein
VRSCLGILLTQQYPVEKGRTAYNPADLRAAGGEQWANGKKGSKEMSVSHMMMSPRSHTNNPNEGVLDQSVHDEGGNGSQYYRRTSQRCVCPVGVKP